MRVLVTSPSMDVGGAERMVALLVNGLRASGVETALLSPDGATAARLEDGVERYLCPRSKRNVWDVLKLAVRIARVLRDFQPDIVHTQNALNTLCVWLGRGILRNRAKIIASFHGTEPSEYPFVVRVLKRTNRVVCVSEELKGALEHSGLDSELLTVVRNGVEEPENLDSHQLKELEEDFDLADGPEGKRYLVVAVGRLVPQKNHRRFIEMVELINSRIENCRFAILGDGPLREELITYANSIGLSQRITFGGVREDARSVIALADVLVFTSDWEGLSIAALEALSCGTPVVTTDTAGMREALQDGGGTITQADVILLAEAVCRYLQDPMYRETAGRDGVQNYRKNFSASAMVASYIDLYNIVEES